MACDLKLTGDILFDCSDAPKRNLDAGKAVLINWDDIDFAASVSSGETIPTIATKSGTTGYAIEWYKDLASATGTYTPDAENVDGFVHTFLCRLPTSSAENADRANELKNGRYVVVYETKYKGGGNAEAFKVAGWGNGLKLSEMTYNTAENSSSILFTLSTEDQEFEQYPYYIYLNTDYDTSKTDFDALFATV